MDCICMSRAELKLDVKSLEKVLNATVMKLDPVSKKATEELCKAIYEESLKLVPKDTGTLASSAYYTVLGNFKTGFVGYIGYGGNGNRFNPKSRRRASEYMIVVHEDLSVQHKNGQAKFLEMPVRRFQGKAAEEIAKIIGGELN